MTRDDEDWPGRAWRGRVDLDQAIGRQSSSRSDLNVTRHARWSSGAGWSDPSPVAEGFVVTSCLRPTRLAEVQYAGRTIVASVAVPAGGLLIFALEKSYSVNFPDPFDAVSIRISRAVLDARAEQLGHAKGRALSEPFVAVRDKVMLNLSMALLPALARPADAERLFVEHVFDAAVFHLLQAPRKIEVLALRPTALSAEHLRIAMGMMGDLIDRDLSTSDIARACGLSVDQFNRGFRAATGVPPHRWRLQRRVSHAMELLDRTNLALSEIAAACGFADQSHLTRVFNRQIGTSPGAWRRSRGS